MYNNFKSFRIKKETFSATLVSTALKSRQVLLPTKIMRCTNNKTLCSSFPTTSRHQRLTVRHADINDHDMQQLMQTTANSLMATVKGQKR